MERLFNDESNFKENDHPRADDGKFKSATGSRSIQKQAKQYQRKPLTFGTAYKEYSGKPDEAIEKLIKEKQGYVPAAQKHKLLGDISFVWGENDENNRGYGLKHIYEKHGERVLKNVSKVIGSGYISQILPNKIFVDYENMRVVLKTNADDESLTWVVTGFEFYKQIKHGR